MQPLTSPPIAADSLPWMPLAPGIATRPLRFAGEERTQLLKVDPGTSVGLHAHSGFVHAYTISGARRLDGGIIAGPTSVFLVGGLVQFFLDSLFDKPALEISDAQVATPIALRKLFRKTSADGSGRQKNSISTCSSFSVWRRVPIFLLHSFNACRAASASWSATAAVSLAG